MGMAAALWDVLAKAANLAQISGLHAVMLVAVAVSLLRTPQSKRECAKLERCSRRLRALLQWPAGSGAALLCSEMGGSVTKALVDAAGLVESCKKSTLWCRLRRSRSMANQLRNMQDVLDAYCGLLLFINAAQILLLQHPTPHHSPSSSGHTWQSSSVQALVVTNCSTVTTGTSDAQRDNDVGSQTCNTTEPAAGQRNEPARDSDLGHMHNCTWRRLDPIDQ